MRIAVFSRGPDVLADIQGRLRKMKHEVNWLDVQDFGYPMMETLAEYDRIIVDEVDQEFWALEKVMHLEDWLVTSPQAPVRYFLERKSDHHLDFNLFPQGDTFVNHSGDEITDEHLCEFCYAAGRREHADVL